MDFSSFDNLDIGLIIRSAVSTTYNECIDFEATTLQEMCLQTFLKNIDYHIFGDDAVIIAQERKMLSFLDVNIFINGRVEMLKILLLLSDFHREHNKFFQHYDRYFEHFDVCKDVGTCVNSLLARLVYQLDDLYDGNITLYKEIYCHKETWHCSLNVQQIKKVLTGQQSYDKANLLIDFNNLEQCGDIETNPGPDPKIDIAEEVIQLRQQVEKLKKTLNRQQNKTWRDEDRIKTLKKKARRAQGLMSFCSNTGEAMNVMANGMGPVLDAIKTAMDSISNTGSSIKKCFDIPDTVDVVGSLISVVQLIEAIMNKNLFSCSLICTQLARQCGITLNAFMSLIPTMTKDKDVVFQKDEEEPARVSESLLDNIVNYEDRYPLIAIGTTIVGIITLFCKGMCPNVKEMATHFGIIGRAAQGMRSVRDFLVWIYEYMLGIFCQFFYGISFEEFRLTKEFPEIAKINGGIKVVEEIPESIINNSTEVCRQIVAMYMKLELYIIDGAKTRSKNLGFLQKLKDKLKKYYEKAIASPAMSDMIREEPMCLYLYGEPGVGKSTLLTVLISDYYKKYCKDKGKNYNTMCYARKSEQEHWDGYAHNEFVTIDEFGNYVDSLGNPNKQYSELQYMVNSAPYPLWYARCEKKGTEFFDSPNVAVTANVEHPEIVHLVDPGSILRRPKIYAQVICKPQYGTMTGIDKTGNAYCMYNKSVAAQYLNKPKEEIDDLMTEQYIIKIYTVTLNKQTKTVTRTDIATQTYDEFFEYYCKIKEEHGNVNKGISDALRKRAGVEPVPEGITDSEVMAKFASIFNPESLVSGGAKLLADSTKSGESEEETTSGKKTEFKDAVEQEIDADLIDISETGEAEKKWSDKLWKVFKKAETVFMNTMKHLYKKIASGISYTCSKMVGVARAFLAYLGGVLSSYTASFYFSLSLDTVLVSALGFLIGWMVSKYIWNSPSSCEFSLTLDETYTPCKRCDICRVMEYNENGNYLSHFLYRIGVPQVRAALMRSRIWTEEYLSKIFYKTEQRMRIAERAYSAQPAMPRPTHYAQGWFGCAMKNVAKNISKCTTYSDAMTVIGAVCWYNCSDCEHHGRLAYNPMDNNDCIRVANDIVRQHPAFRSSSLLVQQGSRPLAESDLVRVEQCTNILQNNSVWLQAVNDDEISSRSTGTFLVGRTLVTTAHSILSPSFEFSSLNIQNPHSKEVMTVPIKDCKVSQVKQLDGAKTDLALVTLPPVVPSRPKIINKFMSAKDIDLLTEGDIIMSGYKIHQNKLVINEQQTKRFHISTKPSSYYEHSDSACPKGSPCACVIRIGNHIEYQIDTYPGCCGSLISARNKNIPSKIIGFHVAGAPGEPALGVLATNELISSALKDHIKEFQLPSTYMIDGRFSYTES